MKKDRVKEISMETTVGAFMFTVLLALGVLTILLSRENFLAKKYPLEVLFERVQGLRAGDTVMTRGVQIGRIKSLQIAEDGILVLLTLDQHVVLHDDYRIEIVPSSILGGQHLAIDGGSIDQPALPDGAMARGETPVDIMREASDMVQAMREAMEAGGILDNLKATMRQVNSITAKLEAGEGTIGKLLMDDTLYADLEQIAGSLKDVGTRFTEGQGTLARLLSDDDTMYKDMEEITMNLKVVSQRMADGKGTLGRLLSEDDTLYEDFASGVTAIKDLTLSMNSGEGTLGKLAKDDELYEQAKLLLQEIRAAVDDIRETSPITTFSSVFFGAF